VSPPARILYVSPVAERGGAERTLLNVLRYHDRERFVPSVAFLADGPVVDEVRKLDTAVMLFHAARFRNLSVAWGVIKALRNQLLHDDVRIVFGNMSLGHLYGGLAALATPCSTVWFQHGIPKYFEGLEHAAACVPSQVTFVTSRAARRAQKRLRPFGKIEVVPGAVDLDKFDPTRIAPGELRRVLSIKPEHPIVACIARLQRWKGQTQFLSAAALVQRTMPEVHFVLIGGTLFGLEPEYNQELRQQAERLPLPERIHFLGHCDDVAPVLADVDILVHCPLSPEPFGLALVEAMAMGKPVIATDAGGPSEIVQNATTGFLVPPGDTAKLADRILFLLSDRVVRSEMGARAMRIARDRYSAPSMVRLLEEHLTRIIDKPQQLG